MGGLNGLRRSLFRVAREYKPSRQLTRTSRYKDGTRNMQVLVPEKSDGVDRIRLNIQVKRKGKYVSA